MLTYIVANLTRNNNNMGKENKSIFKILCIQEATGDIHGSSTFQINGSSKQVFACLLIHDADIFKIRGLTS